VEKTSRHTQSQAAPAGSRPGRDWRPRRLVLVNASTKWVYPRARGQVRSVSRLSIDGYVFLRRLEARRFAEVSLCSPSGHHTMARLGGDLEMTAPTVTFCFEGGSGVRRRRNMQQCGFDIVRVSARGGRASCLHVIFGGRPFRVGAQQNAISFRAPTPVIQSLSAWQSALKTFRPRPRCRDARSDSTPSRPAVSRRCGPCHRHHLTPTYGTAFASGRRALCSYVCAQILLPGVTPGSPGS
jgi:hypothetical protein